jgi:hypothetical protein
MGVDCKEQHHIILDKTLAKCLKSIMKMIRNRRHLHGKQVGVLLQEVLVL